MMVYLFSAYFVLWAFTFGYLFFLGARQRQLQREVEHLRREQRLPEPSDRGSP